MLQFIFNLFRKNPYRFGYTDQNGKYVSQRDAVLSYIKDHADCTREDVHNALKIRKASATGRIAELKDMGKIVHSGRKYERGSGEFNTTLRAIDV